MQTNVLIHLSNIVIPALVFYIVMTGIAQKKDIYQSFTKGAKEGIMTVFGILPTLIGLMTAVGVLRASGFLSFLGRLFGYVFSGFEQELLSFFMVKLFSSSAATGLLLDIYKQYGTDSYAGLAASLAASSTETIFYTMSVYFMSIKVTKTRWTLPGALISTFAGILASVLLAKRM